MQRLLIAALLVLAVTAYQIEESGKFGDALKKVGQKVAPIAKDIAKEVAPHLKQAVINKLKSEIDKRIKLDEIEESQYNMVAPWYRNQTGRPYIRPRPTYNMTWKPRFNTTYDRWNPYTTYPSEWNKYMPRRPNNTWQWQEYGRPKNTTWRVPRPTYFTEEVEESQRGRPSWERYRDQPVYWDRMTRNQSRNWTRPNRNRTGGWGRPDRMPRPSWNVSSEWNWNRPDRRPRPSWNVSSEWKPRFNRTRDQRYRFENRPTKWNFVEEVEESQRGGGMKAPWQRDGDRNRTKNRTQWGNKQNPRNPKNQKDKKDKKDKKGGDKESSWWRRSVDWFKKDNNKNRTRTPGGRPGRDPRDRIPRWNSTRPNKNRTRNNTRLW